MTRTRIATVLTLLATLAACTDGGEDGPASTDDTGSTSDTTSPTTSTTAPDPTTSSTDPASTETTEDPTTETTAVDMLVPDSRRCVIGDVADAGTSRCDTSC